MGSMGSQNLQQLAAQGPEASQKIAMALVSALRPLQFKENLYTIHKGILVARGCRFK